MDIIATACRRSQAEIFGEVDLWLLYLPYTSTYIGTLNI